VANTLTDANLDQLAGRVVVPTYDRGAVSPGIVHFGVGGFHRAHQAVYLDDLAQQRISNSWGVVGVGLRRSDMKHALSPQDYLYTLIERSPDEDRARVVGAMRRCMFGPDDPAAVLAALTSERTRMVTLTITGDGYDTAGAGPSPTAFSYIVEALRRRRRAGHAPFTVVSCDNVPRNGEAARTAVIGCAQREDELFAHWIERNVAFPSGVVDRITPETTDETRWLAEQGFGVRDRSPVATEPFTQWILEDAFCNTRPPLEDVGVQFVADAAPYELMKKRLLNGGHSALGYLGYLAGHRRTDQVLADPVLHDYLAALLDEEIAPLLPPVPGVDLASYTQTLLRRFANPRVGDPLTRICGRGSTKVPAYLLPSLCEAVDRGRPHELLTLALAGWFRYLRGDDDAGGRIEINDVNGARLQRIAVAAGDDPRPLLDELGPHLRLRHNDAFVRSLELTMQRLGRLGSRATADAALSRQMAAIA
jgi:fructuronate reductase/mannitol 2-dehydrogenase